MSIDRLARSICALLLLSGVSQAALITNGSFEDTTGLSGGGSFFTGVPNGWTFTNDAVQLLTASIPTAPSGFDGNLYVEVFTSSDDFGTLSQTISGLIVGQVYEVSFLWGNRGTTPAQAFDFDIEIGGSTFSRTGSGLVNMTPGLITFTAASVSHSLNLTFNDPGSSTVTGGALDAFVINQVSAPVPEPSTLAMFGLGAIGLVARRPRKKRAAEASL